MHPECNAAYCHHETPATTGGEINAKTYKMFHRLALLHVEKCLHESYDPFINGLVVDGFFARYAPTVLEQYREGLVTPTEAVDKLVDEWSLVLHEHKEKSTCLGYVLEAHTNLLRAFLSKSEIKDLCQEFLTEGFLRENFTTNPFTVLHELQKALLDEK